MKAAQLDDGTWALLYEEQAEQAAWPREPVTWFRMWTGDPRAEGEGGEGGDGAAGGVGGVGGGGGEGGGEGNEPPDLEALFGSFRNDVLQRFDGIEQHLLEPEDDGEGQGAGEGAGAQSAAGIFDRGNFTTADYDENGYLKPEAEQRAIQSEISRQVAAAMAPVHESQAEERRNAQADALQARYPIFADPAARAPILHSAQQLAAGLARSTGQRELGDLWRNPEFLETVYLGTVGKQAAEREAQAAAAAGDGSGVTLERGGSAGPAAGDGGDQGKETADRLVNLARKEKFRLGTPK